MEDEEDLYDCVYDDEEGGEIYEDLMKTEAVPPPVSPPLLYLVNTPYTLIFKEPVKKTNADQVLYFYMLFRYVADVESFIGGGKGKVAQARVKC